MMSDDDPAADPSGASTLRETLASLDRRGFGVQFVVDPSGLRCGHCGATTSFAEWDVAGSQRLEGASDPADMLIVVWGTCSVCDRGGAATIGYGPNAGDHDVAALNGIRLDGPG